LGAAQCCLLIGWAAAIDPPFEALLRQGLVALDRNELTAALAHLEKASRLQPRDARVWLALAQTHRKSGRGKLARVAAARAAALAPEDPLILHGLAIFHSEEENWKSAGEFEARYAEKRPSDRDAFGRASSFYVQAGEPKAAIELAQKGLARENRADLRNLLGKAYEAAGQFDQTIVELQEAIRLSPYEEAYYFDLGYVLLMHQNFDAAIRILESARKVFDKSAQMELTLGIAYYGQRRFSEAVDSFLRASSLAPQLEQPHVFLGRILGQAGARLPEIIRQFAAFAAADPQNHLGYFLQAKALAVQGDADPEAETLLRKSIALQDKFWESRFELALLLEQKRDFAGAAAELERAVQLNPQNPTPHYRLARIYDRLGKSEQAQAERALHEKLAAEEKAAIQKHAAGLKRLELVVK